MKSTKLPPLVTETLEVKWSNLLKPDTNFGENSANHNITVVADKGLQKTLAELLKKSGAKKLNGMVEKEGIKYVKFKSKNHIDKVKFPCVDALAKETDVVAFGGDKVRLKLQPMVLSRDNSLSLYLNGVQIIEKNNTGSGSGNGFAPVEGGFVSTAANKSASTTETEEVTDDDIPF
jgi:hypothetical protein